MRTLQRACMRWTMLGAIALASPAAIAQSAIGSSCGTLDADSGEQTFLLDQSAVAGSWIIVSVATDSAQVQFATDAVTDTAGNSYPIYDVIALQGNGGILATFAGRAATALSAGAAVTVHYAATGADGTQGCVAATAFAGVAASGDPSDGYAEQSYSGTDWNIILQLPTQYPNELVYSAFASAGMPGAIAMLAPAQGLGEVCSNDQTLCLLPAWNIGAPMAGIYESADAQSANSVNWGALLLTFQNNDRIFADGFDGD